MSFAEWNGHREGAASSHRTGDLHRSTMKPRQLPHQGQANSRTLEGSRANVFHTMKALKDPQKLPFRYARAGIRDGEVHGFADLVQANRYPALKGELEGIGEKIEYDLFPHVAVDVHRLGDRLAFDAECKSRFFHCRAEGTAYVFGQLAQVRRLIGRLHASGFDAREIKQGVDQLEESEGITVRHHQLLAPLWTQVLAGLRQHLLERAQHESEGGSEFMAYIAEKLCFGAIQLGKCLGSPALRF